MACNNTSANYQSNVSSLTNNSVPGNIPSLPELTTWFKIVILSMYVITFLIGSTGNILICYILLSRKRNRLRGIHLLTINLACSDLIVLFLYLPAEMYQINSGRIWIFGHATCKVIYSINSITVNASIGTLIFITRDRYVAVVKPMSIHKRTSKLIKRSIVSIWFISILLTVPLFVAANIQNGFCTELWPDEKAAEYYWTAVFFIQFVVPLFYLSVCYCVIIYKLHTNYIPSDSLHLTGNSDSDGTSSNQSSMNRKNCNNNIRGKRIMHRKMQQSKMVKMSVVLVIAYVVCISPQHAVYFLSSLLTQESAKYVFTLANYMMILNSCLNPLIYGALSSEIKQGMQKFLLCKQNILSRAASSRIGRYRNSFNGKPKKSSAITLQMSLNDHNSVSKKTNLKSIAENSIWV